jgi:outer membrane immunogenic protein
MRSLLICGISVLTALTFVAPAMADGFEKPRKPRATAPARAAQPAQQQQQANWSGSQAGGSNGSSSVNNNFVEPGSYNFLACSGPCYETPFEFNSKKATYIIGGFLGYRQQFGNFVLGVEGDINWKSGSTSKVQNTPYGPPLFLEIEQFTGSMKQGVDGSLRLRAGVLVTPWTLVYATGGLAIGQVSGSFSYLATACPDSCYSVWGASSWTDTRVGGTVGGGVETALWAGVKARAEYRYTHLGSYSKNVPLTNDVPGGCSPSDCGYNARLDLRATDQRVMVGLGFDLGR